MPQLFLQVFFEIFLLDKDGNYLSDYDLKMSKEGYGLLAEQLENFNVCWGEENNKKIVYKWESFQRVTNKVKSNLNEIERVQSQFRAIESRDRSSLEVSTVY